jgi:hypothetical protein
MEGSLENGAQQAPLRPVSYSTGRYQGLERFLVVDCNVQHPADPDMSSRSGWLTLIEEASSEVHRVPRLHRLVSLFVQLGNFLPVALEIVEVDRLRLQLHSFGHPSSLSRAAPDGQFAGRVLSSPTSRGPSGRLDPDRGRVDLELEAGPDLDYPEAEGLRKSHAQLGSTAHPDSAQRD